MMSSERVFPDTNKRDLVSVSEALRKNFGTIKCKGTIIGLSKLFKMISKVEFYCDNCQKLVEIDFPFPEFDITTIKKICDKCYKYTKNAMNLQYKNAVTVELQDTDSFNDLDRLPVFLFDNDTEGIRIGENIVVTGDIRIINNKKRYFTYLYAESIQYLNREDFTLTKLDIEAIKRFRNTSQR